MGSFYDAVYADGLCLIYGIGWTQTSPGLVLASRDEGVIWTAHQLTGDQPFWSAVGAGNSVMFSGGYGALIQSAPLTEAAPRILQPMLSSAIQPGEPLGLLGQTYGSAPMTYEWYRDGALMPEAAEPLLSLPNLPEGSSHQYALVTLNALGSVTNGPASVVVGRSPVLGIAGGASVNASLAGTSGLTYRVEFKDGSPAGGDWQTLTNLTLTGATGTFNDAPPTNRFYRAELLP